VAETKKIHLALDIPAPQAELFRVLVHNLNYQDVEDPTKYTGPSGVEILYEEACRSNDEPTVEFSLWFDKPATAYWFAGRLHEAKAAWQVMAADEAARAAYPKFFYHPKLVTWLRYNSPECFCLVSSTQLQVRRERAQDLFKAEEVEPTTEHAFLEVYLRTRDELRGCATKSATYQRRGAPGHEWFYCNPLHAGSSLPQHVRLCATDDEYGRSWQLMWAHDTNRFDGRRVASTEQEFEQQLAAMLADIAAVATGQAGREVRRG
jgi:hypothetical protein